MWLIRPCGEEKAEALWVGTDGPDFTAHLYVSISYLVSLSLSFLACKMGRLRPPSEGCVSQGQREDVEPRTLVKPTAPHPKPRLGCWDSPGRILEGLHQAWGQIPLTPDAYHYVDTTVLISIQVLKSGSVSCPTSSFFKNCFDYSRFLKFHMDFRVSFSLAKENRQQNRKPTAWEKILSNKSINRGLNSKICKQHTQLSKNKKNKQTNQKIGRRSK